MGTGEFDFSNKTAYSLVKAYIDLMSEKSYDKITVSEIANRCNVARSTFYLHFEDSFDLLEKVERMLLGQLVLYKKPVRDGSLGDGTPFESMERWFSVGIAWRRTLKNLFGENGDPYFYRRLQNQIRANLNAMMDYDHAPADELRPYYVELLTASYIGILSYITSVDDEEELIDVQEMAHIANSTRAAYFRIDEGAPAISDEQLYGSKDEAH